MRLGKLGSFCRGFFSFSVSAQLPFRHNSGGTKIAEQRFSQRLQRRTKFALCRIQTEFVQLDVDLLYANRWHNFMYGKRQSIQKKSQRLVAAQHRRIVSCRKRFVCRRRNRNYSYRKRLLQNKQRRLL